MKLRFLSANDVRTALPMSKAIEAMKIAYTSLALGQVDMPLRSHVDVAENTGTTLVMPAYLKSDHQSALGVKIVSVFPKNAQRGDPIIHALVMVLDAATGQPLCIMEGSALTAIRTGAASGAATEILARPNAKTAAIFGCGTQARTQLEAICNVRDIHEVYVYSLDTANVSKFVDDMQGNGAIPQKIHIAKNPDEAIQDADVICTATTSSTPVFNGRSLAPGTHINGIGSYLPTMREVDTTTIQNAWVVVDSVTAVLAEAGDLIQPIAKGIIDKSHIQAELGEIMIGKKLGRTNPEQITFFKSVGVAVQDTAAAQIVLENAKKLGLGTEIEL